MKKTKLMCLVLAAVLLLGLAVPAMAADEEFVIKNNVFVQYKNEKGGDVVIPNGITEIYDGAFKVNLWDDQKYITSITIPSSVTRIGKEAFWGCSGVTSLDIPSGVTEIGEFAFAGCSGVTSFVIPSGITRIAKYTFSSCASMTSVNIPSSVTSIQEGAFSSCSSLTSITIPSSVKGIYKNAFNGCSSLTSVVIPSGVRSIAYEAFCDCTNLISVTLPTSIGIDSCAFLNCDKLTDVYYEGTKEQWEALNLHDEISYGGIGRMNPLLRATIHYNSAMPGQTEQPTPTPTTTSFTDVPANAYYADAVKWAVDKGITNGTGTNTFSPNNTCTTAQILTFLWRACGSPKTNAANSFTDVRENAYYYDAAQWAKAQGMISGSTLAPETPCTRASTVKFIWQAAGKPAAASPASFTDVPANADYAAAVSWAVENGVTNGTGTNTFSPDTTCTRGQIATFLYRAIGK